MLKYWGAYLHGYKCNEYKDGKTGAKCIIVLCNKPLFFGIN